MMKEMKKIKQVKNEIFENFFNEFLSSKVLDTWRKGEIQQQVIKVVNGSLRIFEFLIEVIKFSEEMLL